MTDPVIVVGGGAAGMMAAGTAASRNKNVILIEKNKKTGKKLLLTGKGRCNLTNASNIEIFFDNIVKNEKFLYSAFYTFNNKQLRRFFRKLGVPTKVERGQRVFPVSNRAADIVNALRKFLKKQQVKIITGKAKRIITDTTSGTGTGNNNNSKNDGGSRKYVKELLLRDNRRFNCSNLIIATGGLSYPVTGSSGDGYDMAEDVGHTVTQLKPALVPLETQTNWTQETDYLTLKNVSIRIKDKNNNIIFEKFGEMSFTDYGFEGPIILTASSYLQYPQQNNYRLIIDLKPALSLEQLDKRLEKDFQKYSRKYFGNSLNDLLPIKLIPVIIKLSNIPYNKPGHQITVKERREFAQLLKNLTLKIKRFRPIEEAIVTSGGVDVSEINPGTMESKIVSGLFFAGEILDVDALTGGYNLQIAFSTGRTAGLNCE